MGLASLLRRCLRRLLRSGFYWLFGLVGAGRRLLRTPRETSGPPSRVLIVRLDLLGDVLSTMPLANALRAAYPSSRLTIVTLPYTAALARMNRSIDEVVEVDTNRIRTVRGALSPRTWRDYLLACRRLRASRFDLAISVHGRMASLVAFLSGAYRSIGYGHEAFPNLLTDPFAGGRHLERKHEFYYVAELARHAGAKSVMPDAELAVPISARATVDRLLHEFGIDIGDRIVVIHAGSVNGSAKRWPADSWARFAEAVRETSGAHILLAGAASDEPIAREVSSACRVPVHTFTGRTSIEELAALLARADLVASGDSGPLHLAVALGTPVLAVYGPTDPVIYGPLAPRMPARLHRADLACSPCYTLAGSAECPLGDPICMRLVTVRQMAESAIALLGQAGSSTSTP